MAKLETSKSNTNSANNNMIIFENKGLIDIHAITIMGVSVKQENAIGYFGTGLKYAIATLLREGQKITIWRGKKRISFKTKSVEIRGKMFDLIYMGDKELGFTTELGRNWKIWQAFREIYCNCKDESGETKYMKQFDGGKKDTTQVVVEGEKFEEVYDTRELYFIEDEPDFRLRAANVHTKPTRSVFYKGISVLAGQLSCLHTWNITRKIELTEDRTAKYDFQLDSSVSTAIATSTDEEFIESCVLAPDGTFESDLDFSIMEAPSKEFLNVCASIVKDFTKGANRSAINYAKKHITLKNPEETFELNKVQSLMFNRAKKLLNRAGYGGDGYTIRFVKNLGKGIMGQAKSKKIYISESAFSEGTKELALTLLEEYWHLSEGFSDETRDFQNFLITQIGTLIERINGEPF